MQQAHESNGGNVPSKDAILNQVDDPVFCSNLTLQYMVALSCSTAGKKNEQINNKLHPRKISFEGDQNLANVSDVHEMLTRYCPAMLRQVQMHGARHQRNGERTYYSFTSLGSNCSQSPYVHSHQVSKST